MSRLLRTLFVATLLLPATPALAQTHSQGANTEATHTGSYWAIYEVGWYFTPTQSFWLEYVHTSFDPLRGTDRDVTVELRNSHLDAAALASGSFNSSIARGVWDGASFSSGDLWLEAGTSYFLSFTNVNGIGNLAANPSSVTSIYVSRYETSEPFSEGPYGSDNHYGVMYELGGSTLPTEVVPEPITMVLLGTGLVGVGGAARRRRRDPAES